MRYPESMLSADESVVFDVHHHASVLMGPVLLFFGFLAAWLVVLFLASSSEAVIFGGLAVLLVLSLVLAWKVQVWTHANLVLTNLRLIYQNGVISRRSREVPLSKINDVSFVQLVLGRLLGMGDLIVETASESGPLEFYRMPAPDKLKMQILERIHTVHAAQASQGPADIQKEVAAAVERHQPTAEFVPLPAERPPLYSEIVDQIERLDAMRERGVLSPEEFQQAKDALLNRLSSGEGT
jgi:uncharacterized membrane protein YdbT with pleckstrin-like domain